MTKKHFTILAEALKSSKPEDPHPIFYTQWEHDVQAVADACQEVNSNFNRPRFLEACGYL